MIFIVLLGFSVYADQKGEKSKKEEACKKRKEYVFSVGKLHQKDLDAGTLSENLRASFKKNSHELSKKVTIKILRPNSFWIIKDQGHSKEYSIRLGKGELNVFDETTPFFQRMLSFLGIVVLLGIGYLLSVNRKAIKWRPVIWGVALQIIFGMIVLSPHAGKFFFNVVDKGVKKLLSFSEEGAGFVLQSVSLHKSEEPSAPQYIFSLEMDQKKNLDQAKLNEELRQKFALSGYPLSANINVGVVRKDSVWSIGDKPQARSYTIQTQRNLFDLDLKNQKALDGGGSKELFEKFAKNKLSLSKDVKIKVVKSGEKWSIKEKGREYSVIKDAEILKVYGKNALYVFANFQQNIYPKGGTSFINQVSPSVKTFAFWVLPTVIFFSALMTILYYLGVMQHVVKVFAWVMQRTMGTSGSESLSAAANIFVGQTEAPLVVKPFVEKMTKSELHAIMVGGFATVAGGVMAAYVMFLKDLIPGIAGHLVIASIMSAPAALAISKIMYPETEESMTAGDLKMTIEKTDANVIEAAARGASEGMQLTLNIVGMLVAFVGIISLLNYILGFISFGGTQLSLQLILGWIFYPIAYCMGVPAADCFNIAKLLGEKLVLTEFLAYINLSTLMSSQFISQRAAIIASYALCGFANFASIGIQIGGIGGIAPNRRADLAKLGIRAMIGGALAACMTGTIAGILI